MRARVDCDPRLRRDSGLASSKSSDSFRPQPRMKNAVAEHSNTSPPVPNKCPRKCGSIMDLGSSETRASTLKMVSEDHSVCDEYGARVPAKSDTGTPTVTASLGVSAEDSITPKTYGCIALSVVCSWTLCLLILI
eukprot:GHVN01052649.1.p1 GENE.GHVN01052649.1~~GHVN01052649.1.p1  ORF type:complete len:135 (+),score=7.16 GHVN01052649.1:45-449(+)